jgi:hypothetical protein
MATATATLISEIVDYQMAIEDIAFSSADRIRLRFAELLRDSSKVNAQLTFQFLKSEIEATDLPADFWDLVADAQEWTFDQFHEVPFNDRGEAWEMARQVRVAVAQRQAILESGALIEAMRRGIQTAEARRPLLDKIDMAELQADNKFKSKIRAKREALTNGNI